MGVGGAGACAPAIHQHHLETAGKTRHFLHHDTLAGGFVDYQLQHTLNWVIQNGNQQHFVLADINTDCPELLTLKGEFSGRGWVWKTDTMAV